jgi:GT2 family glycosyltransferase
VSRTTILMLSVDEAALLERSLPAALAQGPAEAVRVVVVDNACTDATVTVCERHGADLVRLRTRVSYAAAINAGLAQTGGDDAVLLLNADCVLAEGFLAAARRHLGRPRVGSVAPKLVRSTGMTPAERLDVLDTVGMVVDRRRKNGLVAHGEPAARHRHAAEVFGGDGACVLYRREVLDACAVGSEVLDEDLELWATDVDLAWRAQLLGWRCIYEPAALAWHKRFYSPSTRAALPEAHRRLQFRNRYLMMANNDTLGSFLRDLPRIALYEVLALGHVLLRERHLLRGYAEALRLLPAARARRAVVQPLRARDRRVPFGLTAPR